MVSPLGKDKVGMTCVSKKKASGSQWMFPGTVADAFECTVTETMGKDCMCRRESQVLDRPSEVKMVGTDELLDGGRW